MPEKNLVWHQTFWNVDRQELKEQGLLMVFLKKLLFRSNGTNQAQKWHVFVTLDLL